MKNSLSVLQRHINAIFLDLASKGIAISYVDDIIIPGKTENEAIINIKRVIKQCEDYGLVINFRKCCFLKKKIDFLGNVIENHKISISEGKTQAVTKFIVPNNQKQLKSFLGLVGYFRKFIPKFSIIAKPLTDLL